MNVNNNKNHSVSSKQVNKETKTVLDKNTRMNILLKKCKEALSEDAERQVPENGNFRRVSVAFNIPETNNQGILFIDCDTDNPKTQRTLSVGVHNKNSDRLVSNFIASGTKEEILATLKQEESLQELVDAVNHLSDKTDEYHSSL